MFKLRFGGAQTVVLKIAATFVIASALGGCSTPYGPPQPSLSGEHPPSGVGGETWRKQIVASFALGQLTGELWSQEWMMSSGDKLTREQVITVRTGLDRIKTTFANLGVPATTLPTTEDFSGTSTCAASSAADDSTFDTIDIHFGHHCSQIYCLARDITELAGIYDGDNGTESKTHAKDVEDTLKDLDLTCQYLGLSQPLNSKSIDSKKIADFYDTARDWVVDSYSVRK